MNAAHVAEQPASSMQPASLAAAVAIMLALSLYPPLAADAAGKADHGLSMALFWAMSAGFVRGVGFVPRTRVLRWLFSGWACLASLLAALSLKLLH